MAKSLIASMAGDFDPSQYTDEYRAALQAVIDAKVEGREVVEIGRAGDLRRRRGGRSDGGAAGVGRGGQERAVGIECDRAGGEEGSREAGGARRRPSHAAPASRRRRSSKPVPEQGGGQIDHQIGRTRGPWRAATKPPAARRRLRRSGSLNRRDRSADRPGAHRSQPDRTNPYETLQRVVSQHVQAPGRPGSPDRPSLCGPSSAATAGARTRCRSSWS